MKIKYLIVLMLFLSLTSCEPVYEDTFYFKNLSGQAVTCKLEHNMISGISYTNNVTIPKSEKKKFFSIDVRSTGGSCFDTGSVCILNDNDIIAEFKIVLIFEDGTSIIYDKNSSFSKNPCIAKDWEIFNIIDKRLNQQYHAQYTITEEDYLNATSLQK